MAATEHDHFASIVDQCRFSASQEDLLVHSIFAREDEVFADGGGKSTAEGSSGRSHKELKGVDDPGETDPGEFFAVCADCEAKQELGFSGERKRSSIEAGYDAKVKVGEKLEVGLEKNCSKEGETPEKGSLMEPPLKKSRVSGFESPNVKGGGIVSPLVHCTEKIVIDSEDIGTPTMVVRSGLKVEIVSPLRCIALDSGQCTEKLDSEDGNDDQVGESTENPAKKKLEFEEQEGNGVKNREIDPVEKDVVDENRINIQSGDDAIADASEKPKDDDSQSNDMSHGTKKQGKRELPRSLLGQVWGSTAESGEAARKGVTGSGTRKDGSDEVTTDVNGNGKSKADESIKHLFDVLRTLAVEACYADSVEIDIFETAKSHGITFPQSRFRLGTGSSD